MISSLYCVTRQSIDKNVCNNLTLTRIAIPEGIAV